MVLGRTAPAVPSLVVPDELALTMWGHDPYVRGLAPIAARGAARTLLIAKPVPLPLRVALMELEAALPAGTRRVTVTLSGAAALASEHAVGVLGHEGHAGHGHDGHAEREHHGMMEIIGEPSADGLVMEPIDFSFGPLLTPLPGGVVLDVQLDGDVVSRCTARATLLVSQPSGITLVPDPLASSAWTAVLDAAAEFQAGIVATDAWRWQRVAAVEFERAVSHLAWLRGFARLLGWTRLVERVQPALQAVSEARAQASRDSASLAAAGVDRVLALLRRSGTWTARTQGNGVLGGDASARMYGPNARAAGVARDARTEDPLYIEMGFEPVSEHDADARSRTMIRAREAAQSIRLASLALLRASAAAEGSRTLSSRWTGMSVVEGPRGPLTARATDAGLEIAAPGERVAISEAGRGAVGHEWASALVAVASLDLSPWRVVA